MTRARVLIVKVGAMGDVLHALPAVAALRAAWPPAELHWVVDERWASLLTLGTETPLVDRIHVAQTRLWSRAPLSPETRRSILALRRSLQQQRYDAVVDLQGTLRSATIGRLARAQGRFGFRDPREAVARYFYTRAPVRRGAHVVEQNAALLGEALGVVLQPAEAVLPRSAETDRWAAAMVPAASPPVALLAPTAGWGAKQWPAERFGALAKALAGQGWVVLINTTHALDPVPAAVKEASAGAARLVTPTVGQLVALTRRLSLVVAGDTGPLHLAAALGTPSVALFGPTDPVRNGPWGSGPAVVLRSPVSNTSYKRSAITEEGLAALSVEQVLAAVSAMGLPRT